MSKMKVIEEVVDLGLLVETLDCYARSRDGGWWEDCYEWAKVDEQRRAVEFIKEICSLMGFKKPKTKQVLLALEAQE